MAASNADIAKVFDEIADLLEILDENAFRVRAYRNAARLIEGLGDSVSEIIAKGEDVTELPGIGKDLAKKISEIVAAGTCAALEDLRKKLPPTITTLLRIPGLGPKRVQALYRNLDISTPEQLYAAVTEGKVRGLPGFGEKTETAIRQALGPKMAAGGRFTLAAAAQAAEPLREYLAQTPGVTAAVVCGSYRRARETVGDLDIVVTAERSEAAMDRFCEYPEVAEVKAKGDTRATVVLKSGLQVDLRVVPAESFGAALHYFTGSKTHNVAVRRIAQQKKLKINEYGVFRGNRRIAGATEESVFESIGLGFIPPELRENRGEIEAAQADTLPALVALGDLKGDLGVAPPDFNDGLDRLVDAARASLQYLAVRVRTRSRSAAEIGRDLAAVAAARSRCPGFTLFSAVVADIDEDGALALPPIDLDGVDFLGGTIESAFALPRAKQTQRVLRALEHPRLKLLAHPAGRLIPERDALDLDLPRIIRAARERRCLLELDSRPDRLDLPDSYCRLTKEEGVLIAVASNASTPAEFEDLRFGVAQARRGWLDASSVANTRSADEVKELLGVARR
ncbi:MAG: helix-hairpin-helix domain-containing protein [Sulfurifustaceae bacterium]